MTKVRGAVPVSGGGELVYSEQDHGGGPSLVFCHATGFCKEVWQPVVDSLAEICTGWSALLPDQRHHGESQGFDDDYDWWNIGRDVLRVLGDRSEPAIGIGHSGGGAAVAMAEILQPGTFAALVLIEPIIFPPPYEVAETHPLAEMARNRRTSFSSSAEAVAAFRGRGPFSGWQEAAVEAYVSGGFRRLSDGTVVLRTSRPAEAGFFAHAFSHGAWDRLGEVSTPTTLIAGEHSDTHHASFLAEQAARFADATTEIVAGASHFVPMEVPDLVARRVADAVASVSRS